MRREIALVALTICVLGASAARATNGFLADCNYDLTNTCDVDAYDVGVDITGPVSLVEFWDNLGDGHPTVTYANGITSIHWVSKGRIARGQKAHFGYSVEHPPCTGDSCPACAPLCKTYWTDINGRRIGSCGIASVTNHLTGTSYTITNTSPWQVQVTDVRMACQAARLPLSALSAQNQYLSNAMVPIAGSNTLNPGGNWVIPVTPPCSQCYCTTNFNAVPVGTASGGTFSPWVQEYVP